MNSTKQSHFIKRPLVFKRSEFFIDSGGKSNIKLFCQTWEVFAPKGHVIITHGQGEHSDSYHRLVDYFAKDQWNFYAWDMRGHGRSDGKRGYATDFNEYCEDFLTFSKRMLNDPRLKKGPIIFLCHSMGALVQIKALLKNPQITPQAMVLSSPLFGVAVHVPAAKDKGAVLLNSFIPSITLHTGLKDDMLTRDPDVLREYTQDNLRHHRMSPGVYLGMKTAFEEVMAGAPKIRYPTLLHISRTDQVVSSEKAQLFFERLGSPIKKILVYEDDARHELYNDTPRNAVFLEVKKFIDSFL